jgi:TolA-binding protein
MAEGYWEQGLQERRQKLRDKAEVHFRKALGEWLRVINELPTSVDTARACQFAGECYRVLKEYEKAIEYYQMVADNWPDCQYASSAQFLVGYLTKHLMKTGVIPKAEADVVIRDAFERVVNDYPDSASAASARNWLKYNVKPKEGE